MEKALSITKAREEFSSLMAQVQYQGDTFIINRHGKPAVAIVPVQVYEAWKRQRQGIFDTTRGIQEANKGADPDQVMEDVLGALNAIRAGDADLEES
jgi:prevent-host-death family protein